MILVLKDGFKIVLDKNTTVRLTPDFVKNKGQKKGNSWLQILSGVIRAKVLKKKTKKRTIKTKFRSRSMAMGVRGTDFVFSNINSQSKISTIRGKVEVKKVSLEEAEVFDTVVEEQFKLVPNSKDYKDVLKKINL